MLLQPASAPTVAGDFHLIPGSPSYRYGINSENDRTIDLDNNQSVNHTIDIGAYEIFL